MSFSLSDEERAQLSVRADEFHAALVRGAAADWRPFLAGLPERLRQPVLTELVIIDLIHRWAHGDRAQVEDYLRRFPEFGPTDRVPPQVIIEECRCRVKAGERYDLTRFRDRFPAQFPYIQAELTGLLANTVRGPGSGTIPKAEPPPSLPGSAAVADQYEMLRLLGRGQFGEVWLARKKTSGIEKAIKIVAQTADQAPAQRERRALELIKNLRHTYLLATEDFWVADDRLHIVMELADCTLRDRLHQCKEHGMPGIPGPELYGYIREAAEGLDFLHSRHVVHRDVKPDNILLSHGHAKVADFGLAWQQEAQLGPMKTFAGTAAYMAPEVWGKEGGPASDLYSLAVSYIELRQGHPPLRRGALQEMMIAHLDGVHEFDPLIGVREREVLEKALARMPEDRYPSCQAFVEALGAALGQPVAARPVVVPRQAVRPSKAVTPTPRSATPEPESRKRTIAHAGSGTVADLHPRSHVTPFSPRPPAAWMVLAAGLLTLLLLGAFGFGLWVMFWHEGNTLPTNPEEDDKQSGTGSVGGTHPGAGGQTPVVGGTGGGATSGGQAGTGIDPKPPDLPQLPRGALADPGAKVVTLADGRKVYDWVVVKFGNEAVRFRLIPAAGAPFYITESKVWNALYRAGGRPPAASSEANGPDAPVTEVTAEEAGLFAAELGGRLPTPEEWDQAAGLDVVTGRDEVTRPGGQPRVRRARPAPTHGPHGGADVNDHGLRDMAGNGREWTSTPATKVIPGADPSLVILRGRNYTLSHGLTFTMLRFEQKTPQTQFATARSPYTGFRVVLPLP